MNQYESRMQRYAAWWRCENGDQPLVVAVQQGQAVKPLYCRSVRLAESVSCNPSRKRKRRGKRPSGRAVMAHSGECFSLRWRLGLGLTTTATVNRLCRMDGVDLNAFWPTPDDEPDIAGLVAAQRRQLQACEWLGDAIPTLPHLYGRRGTPMTMAWYLGGKIHFSDDTVWVDPCVDSWDSFEMTFDPNNAWVQRSAALMREQLRTGNDALIWMPDFGDALTVMSLLRGNEHMLFDVIEQGDRIRALVDSYVRAFIQAHAYFWDIYRSSLPGDTSVLCWAPGKTYMVQCDFSVMISPEMFARYVVPELEQLSGYLDYMGWHLDGYEEVKHLDMLLDLPCIPAIQIQPGANNPPAASDVWLPIVTRIQQRGKALQLLANSPDEYEILVEQLNPEGLMIICTFDVRQQSPALYERLLN